jgi:hypothetical protein
MTREDIIKLANEAELCQTIWIEEDCIELESVIQFAKLVADKEREACAKVCEESNDMASSYGLAQAIRARNND